MDATCTMIDPRIQVGTVEEVAQYKNPTQAPEVYYRFQVLAEQEGGLLIAWVPRLPGCVTQAKTEAGMLEGIKDAIAGYMEVNDWVFPPVQSKLQDLEANKYVSTYHVLVKARGQAAGNKA